MKAITVMEPGNMQMLTAEEPAITKPDQVLVQIKASGICGSDVHVYHGSNPYAIYPRVIGHEASGIVKAVGDALPGICI